MEAANEPRHILFDGAAEQGLSPIALKPWSLEFTDAAVEARYATIKFTSTYMPFVTFLGAVILLTTLMAVVEPSNIDRHAGSSLVSTALMCGRVYLHQLEDQQRARRLFGRAAVVTAAATAAWLPQAQPPEPISGSVMIAGAVLWCMIPAYLRHIALFFEHHLVYLLVIITGYLFKPPFSELGWFAETILIVGALVLGEIMGYLIERHMRLSYLERASEAPSAAPPPDPASTNTTLVHPWSLEFTNAAAEANYAAAKFAATYMPFVLFLGALFVVLILMVIADARFFEIFAPCTTLLTLPISVRVWAHKLDDQQRARLLFGRAWLGTVSAAWVGLFLTFSRTDPPEPCRTAIMPAVAIAWFAIPIYCRHIALYFSHRLLYNLISSVGIIASPTWSEVGWAAQFACQIGALALGEAVGYSIEANHRNAHLDALEGQAQRQHAEMMAEEERKRAEEEKVKAEEARMESAAEKAKRDAERKAFRVINHTSKRVMSDTAQGCELLVKKLQENKVAHKALGEDGELFISMLNGMRHQSVSGFHMCQSTLLQSSIVRGTHKPKRDEFNMSSLFEDLGIDVGRPRFQFGEVCADTIRADKQVLTSLIFNATQNAITHGQANGDVRVTATLTDDLHSSAGTTVYTRLLRVSVHNPPGQNHAKLLAAVKAEPSHAWRGPDLFRVHRDTLEQMGVGASQSTFQGLDEMRVFASAFRPPADVHLWVQPDGVLFDLSLRVGSGTPTMAQDAAAGAPPTLPAGLAFVCCDDDEMPRIFAQLLITKAAADEDESRVLGETYEEVAGLVEQVLSMAARLGDERVLCVLDQNLDGFDAGRFIGTDLVKELRRRGFGGVLVIQSANDEHEDEAAYKAAGADGSIGKAVKGGVSVMIDKLAQLYHERLGGGKARVGAAAPQSNIVEDPPTPTPPRLRQVRGKFFK